MVLEKKAPVDMWEVLNSSFVINISWPLPFSRIIKYVKMPKGGYLMLQIGQEIY